MKKTSFTFAVTLASLSIAISPSIAEKNPAMSYAIWADGEFETDELSQPEISGKFADPDGDGLNNLMEYALDGDPTYPDRVEVEPSARISGRLLVMDFKIDTSKSDVTVEPLSSTDLKTWRTVESELISTRGTIQKRRVSMPTKSASGFLKIRVTSN